jgi:hypothetical protein
MPDLSKHHPQSTNGGGIVDTDNGNASVAGTNSVGNAHTGDANGIGNGTARNIAGNGNADGAAPAPVDVFSDLKALSMSQAYADIVGVKKLLLTVPVRKPHSQEFVRVHPEFRIPGAPIIELKDDRESFLLTPSVAAMLSPGDFTLKDLFLSMSRQGVLFVWPVPVPADGQRANSWHTSAREAAVLAAGEWIRLSANTALKAYDVTVSPPLVKIPEPEWPTDKSFNDILRIAFKDRVIETVDHPVIQRLLTGA